MAELAKYFECPICEHHHPKDFDGDCRDNENRFTVEQLIEKHGELWLEVQYWNYYHCEYCLTDWEDTWTCQCNDECPGCGKEIEPYNSVEIP